MRNDQPYENQWWMKYFEVEIFHPDMLTGSLHCYKRNEARFKKNRFTGATYVFQSNCCDTGNRWNEHGYGWGIWRKV